MKNINIFQQFVLVKTNRIFLLTEDIRNMSHIIANLCGLFLVSSIVYIFLHYDKNHLKRDSLKYYAGSVTFFS
jgi:hypothetical protein